MTCRLLLLRDGAGSIIDYFTQTRADCVEMAMLWRWGCSCFVWMEAWR